MAEGYLQKLMSQKGVRVSSDGEVSISLKDVETMTAMVARLRRPGAFKETGANMDEVWAHEVLWEIAWVLRVDAAACDEALTGGIVAILERLSVVLFQRIPAKTVRATDPVIHETMYNGLCEIVQSVCFELCRYPAGCSAVAGSAEIMFGLLKGAAGYTSAEIQNLYAENGIALDENSQGFHLCMSAIDTLGRCVCGLDRDVSLQATVSTRIKTITEGRTSIAWRASGGTLVRQVGVARLTCVGLAFVCF
jgi:hypothetical protein